MLWIGMYIKNEKCKNILSVVDDLPSTTNR